MLSVLLLLWKRPLGLTFYSDTDGSDYRVPEVALNSCAQQLFSAKAAEFFVDFFNEIQNKKRKKKSEILLQLFGKEVTWGRSQPSLEDAAGWTEHSVSQ